MPKPLFTKLIVQAAVGFFFLLVGCVYGIHSKDYMFITLSLLIGLCSLIRTYSFYRLIRNGAYRILTGTCRKQVSTPFKKKSQVIFADENQQEYNLALDKDIKLLSGHRYRFYFRQADTPDSGCTEYSSTDLLGYEELSMNTKNIC
ncbi:hypothetical protein AALD74_12205 [Lachnospiraceae bacterium 48-21]